MCGLLLTALVLIVGLAILAPAPQANYMPDSLDISPLYITPSLIISNNARYTIQDSTGQTVTVTAPLTLTVTGRTK